MDQAMLPAGFHDLLFPDAEKKSKLLTQLFSNVQKFGYQLVDPPSIEFEKSLFTGAGKSLKDQTFRVMDPASHKMMGVRSDITTQIARIASTRLKKEQAPLRLSYGGDVFRVKGEGLDMQRQLTQAGIELIGTDSVAADVEVLLVMIRALINIGVTDLYIDFTTPRLMDIILKQFKFSQDQESQLLSAVSKKNIDKIKKIAGKNSDIFTIFASGEFNLNDFRKLKLPKAAKNLVTQLTKIIESLEKSGEDINISIDPAESAKFNYHTGIGFTIFSRSAKCEIGRGGRYEIENDGSIIPAIGATIYIDEILNILPLKQNKERVFVPFGTSWKNIKKISNNDRIIICGLADTKDIDSEAKLYQCSLKLEDNKLVGV